MLKVVKFIGDHRTGIYNMLSVSSVSEVTRLVYWYRYLNSLLDVRLKMQFPICILLVTRIQIFELI